MVSGSRSGAQGLWKQEGAILVPKRFTRPSILSSDLVSLAVPESNSKFKLVSCKCAPRERFCLVGARLCQPLTIPWIDRLPFDTPSGPGSATYVRKYAPIQRRCATGKKGYGVSVGGVPFGSRIQTFRVRK